MVATHCAVMCGLFVHALRCALLLVSLVFGELFFGESPSLCFCTFWQLYYTVFNSEVSAVRKLESPLVGIFFCILI